MEDITWTWNVDFVTSGEQFESTEVTVTPTTEAGWTFFRARVAEGAASATMPKSGFAEFTAAVRAAGLRI